MSGGSISLQSALRTCKVDTGWANKIESDRFLNPEQMVCPIWNGMDTAGRRVCPDSFFTKNPGCNSAEDRVVVENNLRPQYMEYINLSANGIDAAIYGADTEGRGTYGDSMPWNEVGNMNSQFNYPKNKASCSNKMGAECYNNVNNITGNFGKQLSASVYPPCSIKNNGAYQQAMAQEQQAMRKMQALNEGFYGNRYRANSGF